MCAHSTLTGQKSAYHMHRGCPAVHPDAKALHHRRWDRACTRAGSGPDDGVEEGYAAGLRLEKLAGRRHQRHAALQQLRRRHALQVYMRVISKNLHIPSA